MRVAIHQPNFVPWFPFFYKMAMVDYFVIMDNVQFEKNGFQNRFKYGDKWITNPVVNKTEMICEKNYTNGQSVVELNMDWIIAIKNTLGIKAELIRSSAIKLPDDPTRKIIEILKHVQDLDSMWRGKKLKKRDVTYVTNVNAFEKYLNEDALINEGIRWEECRAPKHIQRSTFEVLEAYGIEGARKQLPDYKIKPHIEKMLLEEKHLKIQEVVYKHGTESKEYRELCEA